MKKLALLTILAFVAFGTATADIDNVDIGGDFMFEYFFGDNFDLDDNAGDETDFLRTEGHLWFQADLDDNIMTRFSMEFDRALDQANQANTNDLSFFGADDLDIFLEEAYAKVADIGGTGFSISAGRQFLNFGDDSMADNYNKWWGPGFIIADSAPNDPLLLTELGSYEIDPFDAIVVNYEMEEYSVSGIYARQMEDLGTGIPGNGDSAMTALYGSYFGVEGHQIDVYFTWTDDNFPGGNNFDGESYIVGGRVAGDITPDFAYKGEVAYQFQDNNIAAGPEADAFAGQIGINYHPEYNMNPNIGFIYTYLQEDNGSGFIAPFDGKTFGMIHEGLYKVYNGAGGFTNSHVFNVNGGFEPMQDVAWTADFFYFMADDDIAATNEDDGGFEIDSQIDYQFNEYLRTFLGGGVYFPGDAAEAAFGNNDDQAYFFRTGMKVNF